MTKTEYTRWKLWDGYGPAHDGKMRVARIGPEGGGGITGSEGYDLVGFEADLVLAASAPALLEALQTLTRYVQGELIPSVREVVGGQSLLDKGWDLVGKAHVALAQATKETP